MRVKRRWRLFAQQNPFQSHSSISLVFTVCIFFPSFQSVNLTPLVLHLPLKESPSILCTQNGQGGSLLLLLPPNHLFCSSFPSFLDPGLAFSPPQNLPKPPLALFLHFACLQSRVTEQYSPRLSFFLPIQRRIRNLPVYCLPLSSTTRFWRLPLSSTTRF